MKEYLIRLEGLVQGVGFRHFAKLKAEEFSINGWVKNLNDGRLELKVIGKEKNLQKFIQAIKKGPPLARVENISIQEIKPLELNLIGEFKILK